MFDRTFSTEGLAYISDEAATQLRGARVDEGDVLLNITGDGVTFGRACLAPPSALPACVNQHVSIVRTDRSQCHPGFLLAYLTHPFVKRYIESFNAGGSRRAITKGHIESFQIPLPPLPEQRGIASILSALDDKIELNCRMNETLEALARAIFKSWFVDFSPIASSQSDATDRDDASYAGGLPPGWMERGLDEVARFLNGLAMQKYPPGDGESLPVIKIAELRKGVTASTGRANTDVPAEYIVQDGDLLLSWSGSLDAVIWSDGKGALNQHLFKVTSDRFPKWFVYQWLLHHLPSFRAIAADKATTMGHIQRRHLAEAVVAVPPAENLTSADAIMAPLMELKVANSLQSRTLAQIRDTLLPKLLSGEVRVREAEKLVEAAV